MKCIKSLNAKGNLDPNLGTGGFFSRAGGYFDVGHRLKHLQPKSRAAQFTIETWPKPETAHENSQAPRVPSPSRLPKGVDSGLNSG